MMSNDVRNITELKRATNARGGKFFDPSHSRIEGNSVHPHIYRAPEMPLNEGWVITNNANWLSGDLVDKYTCVYRFEVLDDSTDFRHIGRHETFADAAAFLESMGAK